jgi:hypothetical protein
VGRDIIADKLEAEIKPLKELLKVAIVRHPAQQTRIAHRIRVAAYGSA